MGDKISFQPVRLPNKGPDRSTDWRLLRMSQLSAELHDLRHRERQQLAASVDWDIERGELRTEIERLQQELDALKASPDWRALAPVRGFAQRQPWLGHQLMRAARVRWWTLTLEVHRRLAELLRQRR